jgi:hypothetical protein
MKKLISLIIVLLTICSISVPVIAASDTEASSEYTASADIDGLKEAFDAARVDNDDLAEATSTYETVVMEEPEETRILRNIEIVLIIICIEFGLAVTGLWIGVCIALSKGNKQKEDYIVKNDTGTYNNLDG